MIAVLAVWIQPGGLSAACWLLMFDFADVDVLRLSSQKGLVLQRSQCSRLRENTAFRTIM
jgi:hypothetical protein